MKYLTPLVLIFCITSTPQSADIKIATYNIENLDDKISKTRKDRLRAVLSSLNADIIGFQEIKSVSALDSILSEKYTIGMADTSNEPQKLAIAVRDPFEITNIDLAFRDPSDDDAFPKTRDLLHVSIARDSLHLTVLVHHPISRSQGRLETDLRRERSATKIVSYVDSLITDNPDANIVLLGDFNDNPDDRSLNILEYGDSTEVAGIDSIRGKGEDTFLYNTSEALLDKDYCSYRYHALGNIKSNTFDPKVKGARAENNKWRGKHHDWEKDVEIKANLLDQILVYKNLRSRVVSSGIFNGAEAFRGSKTNRASDHVPVWIVLQFSK